MARKLRLRRGDEVIVVSGRDKGRKGQIVRMQRDRERVIVQGANMVKRHTRPSAGQPGGIVEKEASIHISNVAVVCKNCSERTRIGMSVLEDGRRERTCKKCGTALG